MPLEEYYHGKGKKVMRDMKSRYGEEKGEKVFHATAKKRGFEPSDKVKKKHGIK